MRGRSRKQDALLLLGPTGSGKTPLGRLLEKKGLLGRRCVHLDFGAELRRTAGLKRKPAGFTPKDLTVIRDSLRTGALLEDENFSIAAKIMRRAQRTESMRAGDLLVLNGLPRHEGQAASLAKAAKVKAVVFLKSPLEVTWRRIRMNSGGDRLGRADDSAAEVRKKYRLFMKRTVPLLAYYRRRGVPVLTIPVGAASTPSETLALVRKKLGE